MMDSLIPKAYAVGTANPAFDSLLKKILDNIVNPIILLLMALAVVYFLWGVVMFIQNADNSEKRGDGYQHMVWGIIGIFIMVSAFGIKNLIGSVVGVN